MSGSDEDKALAIFDQLVSEGVLVYGPHETVVREAEGYPVSLLYRLRLPCD